VTTFIWVLVVAFLILFAATSPQAAAQFVHQIWQVIVEIFNGLAAFFNSLAATFAAS
jgi:cell shape-determining protein MreC